MTVRRVLAIVAALLVAAQVVRNAAVLEFAQSRPETAARAWNGHPDAERSLAMTQIARAARSGRPVPDAAFTMIADVARKEPLAPEPFLVKGVQAQLSGDGATAQRAFEAAQWRDPRSLPAAYFLADRYFRIGDSDRGLREIAALARLSPNGSAIIGPYLAAYAASPTNWPALRRLFQANPALADPALAALARNIATIPAVLALADQRQAIDQSSWLGPLLETLTGAGEYAKARAIWAKAANTGARAKLLYDPGFTDKSAPPPFNWTLASSTVGLAERQPGGRLHVVFYGQEDGILASQLLLLPAGTYRMSMNLLGDPARARVLNWSIWCDKADAPIASVTLDGAAARGWSFTVPAGCAAQWLKLSGSSNDLPQQSDVTIAALKLERAALGG
jgi:hypothetical protein